MSSPYLLVFGDDRVMRYTRVQVVLVRHSIRERVSWEKLLLEFYHYCFYELCKQCFTDMWIWILYWSFINYGFLDNFRLIIVLKISCAFGKRSIINEVFIIYLNFITWISNIRPRCYIFKEKSYVVWFSRYIQ